MINLCKIVAKSLQNLSALKFTINESMFYLDIWLVLSFETESAFPEASFYFLAKYFGVCCCYVLIMLVLLASKQPPTPLTGIY